MTRQNGPDDRADETQGPWTMQLVDDIEDIARRSHPADVPYMVAARALEAVEVLLMSRGADRDLTDQLDATQQYLRSLDGPAPLPQLPARRHDPRPRGDARWREVRLQLLVSVQEEAWREAAGREAGVPHDVELTHDIARYLTDQFDRDPVVRAAGARFTALPELGPLAGPGVEGPAGSR